LIHHFFRSVGSPRIKNQEGVAPQVVCGLVAGHFIPTRPPPFCSTSSSPGALSAPPLPPRPRALHARWGRCTLRTRTISSFHRRCHPCLCSRSRLHSLERRSVGCSLRPSPAHRSLTRPVAAPHRQPVLPLPLPFPPPAYFFASVNHPPLLRSLTKSPPPRFPLIRKHRCQQAMSLWCPLLLGLGLGLGFGSRWGSQRARVPSSPL
jgi:hypothetical protein